MYPRLNAALRNHDTRHLEPFLPYMKLLLSGLYQLPLKNFRTYRGVRLELFEVRREAIVHLKNERKKKQKQCTTYHCTGQHQCVVTHTRA